MLVILGHVVAPSFGAPTPSEDAPSTNDDVYELVVEGETDGSALERSADAVTVVRLDQAAQQSADLGEVLARTQGVAVRRTGGLGSAALISLNGLQGDQVRIFVDGVPLALSGFPQGLQNVPVNLVERVDIYKGVVPIRLGADALGGAIDVVSRPPVLGLHGAASYQLGSFGTHRLTAGLDGLTRSGLLVRASAYADRAQNDYPIFVQIPNELGVPSEVRVRRFHDRYAATGASIEAGVAELGWAQQLTLRGFVGAVDADVQNNPTMSVPYGEIVQSYRTAGATGRYQSPPEHPFAADVVASIASVERSFEDLSTCVYDWFGDCIAQRTRPGERGTAADQVIDDVNGFSRLGLRWRVHPAHALRLTVTAERFDRTGDDRLRDPARGEVDLLASRRSLTTAVGGLAWELQTPDDRLEQTVFGKGYLQDVQSGEFDLDGNPVESAVRRQLAGAGYAARLTLGSSLWLKGSYEYAIRQPRADELFGDGQQIIDNPALLPERSHNVNVTMASRGRNRRGAHHRAELTGLLRDTQNLIGLFGQELVFRWQNVTSTRAWGLEAAGHWRTPGDIATFDGTATWLDLRNASDQGLFGNFDGRRVPNRPWLFATASTRLAWPEALVRGGNLSFTWVTRFVGPFSRTWDGLGVGTFNPGIPPQLSHTAGLGFALRRGLASTSVAIEVSNLTDARLFDAFGVQRPGRAVYTKLTGAW